MKTWPNWYRYCTEGKGLIGKPSHPLYAMAAIYGVGRIRWNRIHHVNRCEIITRTEK